jgi:hypothetical protein
MKSTRYSSTRLDYSDFILLSIDWPYWHIESYPHFQTTHNIHSCSRVSQYNMHNTHISMFDKEPSTNENYNLVKTNQVGYFNTKIPNVLHANFKKFNKCNHNAHVGTTQHNHMNKLSSHLEVPDY